MVPHKPEVSPRFPVGAAQFLRALKRHNDREWFRTHRVEFDELIDAPMNAIIERLALDFRQFLPDVIAAPRVSRYRIYRDTRPAGEYLKLKQVIVGRAWPAAFASSPRFYAELLRTFRTLAPLVRFFNAPFRRHKG